MNNIPIEFPVSWQEYQLLDSGQGEKLESFAGYKTIRPDPRAIWGRGQPSALWNQADAVFARNFVDGRWDFKKPASNSWKLSYKDYVFNLKPTDFRHVGIFPEQAVNWDWLERVIDHQPLKILNLFAYTGGATIAGSKAGAKLTHVDSSKSVISWAHENCLSSGLPNDAVRWIEDDVYKFVAREQRRKSFYDAIILDPPRFGHGAKGEIWKLQDDLAKLLVACKNILAPKPKFVLMSIYTADLSAIAIKQLLNNIFNVEAQVAEIAIKEENGDRLLPSGIVGRVCLNT